MDSTRLLRYTLLINRAVALFMIKKKTEKKKKSFWVHPEHLRRKTHGHYYVKVKPILMDFKNESLGAYEMARWHYFKTILRVTPPEFLALVDLIRPFAKKSPHGRPCLGVGHRLAITLRYLATGAAAKVISTDFMIGHSTTHYVIVETCRAIWLALQPLYLAEPTEENFKEIQADFYENWDFPGCVGAVDGKHVRLRSPPRSGTLFFNYKGFFSIILMAIADAKYRFRVVDVGAYGSNSDSQVFKSSTFGKKLASGTACLPPPQCLPGTDIKIPPVFIGDEAFELTSNFMRPFPGRSLDCNEKRIYNYRLSRARRCVENAFGVLVSRWSIFGRSIEMKPENADLIVKACLCLHNYLLRDGPDDKSFYCNRNYADHVSATEQCEEGEWRHHDPETFNTVAATPARNYSQSANEVRLNLLTWFSNAGARPWQYEKAHLV